MELFKGQSLLEFTERFKTDLDCEESGACVFAATQSHSTALALLQEVQRASKKIVVARQTSGSERITMRTEAGTLYLVRGLASHPLGSRQVG